MERHIFREYDIRGVVDRDLDDATVVDIGRAIASTIIDTKGPDIVVGRDCRLSSDHLRDQLVKGLVDAGAHVIDIGVVPTPLVYFYLFNEDVHGGVMITGSHNPPDYNGFKVCVGTDAIHGDAIEALYERVVTGALRHGAGSVTHDDVVPRYLEFMAKAVDLGPRRLEVVIDAGNGTGGVIALPLLERLGVGVVPLYCDMDGRFPHHHPDPTVEANLADVQEATVSHGADVGIAYDGDTDRIGVVDEKGRIIWGDKLMVILSRAILADLPGSTVVGEVKCSQTLFDDIEAHGGRAVLGKVGHSLMKARMKEEHAALAGEMSGHIFFAHRFFGYDDAIYATLRLLEILSHHDGPASSLLEGVPTTYATAEIRVDCPDDVKFAVVDEVTTHFRATNEVIDIDGARVLHDGGWTLCRASNTSPVIVLRAEATTELRLTELWGDLEATVTEAITRATRG